MVTTTHPEVHFLTVGRDNASWVERLEPTEDAIIAAIHRKGAVMSRDAWIGWNEDHDGGSILAGARVVGAFYLRYPLTTPRGESCRTQTTEPV